MMDWPECPRCFQECKQDQYKCLFHCPDIVFCSPQCQNREDGNNHYESECNLVKNAPMQFWSKVQSFELRKKMYQLVDMNRPFQGMGFVLFEFENGIQLAKVEDVQPFGRFVACSKTSAGLAQKVLDKMGLKKKAVIVVLLYKETGQEIFVRSSLQY